MKKSFLVLLILVAIIQVHAQEEIQITLHRTEYAPAETVQLDILLNTIPVKDIDGKNLRLYKEGNKVAIAPFVEKIKDQHYSAYFNLPLTAEAGTYSLEVTQVQMILNGVLQEVTQSIPLTLVEQLPYLAISPGVFILNGQKELKLTVTNKGPSTSITLVTPPFLTHVYQGPQLINQGTSRTFKLTIKENPVPDQFVKIVYEKEYAIPLILPQATSTLPEQVLQQPTTSTNPFMFIAPSSSLERTIDEKKTLQGTITLKNLKNETLSGISLSVTGNLSTFVAFTPSSFSLPPFTEQSITLTVNEKKNAVLQYYSGSIVATYQGFSLPYDMKFTITHPVKINLTATTNQTQKPPKTTDDISSFFNYTIQSTPPKKTKSYALWGLIAALALGVVFSYLLRKQTVKKQTFGQYIGKLGKIKK
jgi:hypothetical protein